MHLMKPVRLFIHSLGFTFLLACLSCSKKTEVFTTEPISDYLPLEQGKYITYRVDSTVFTNLGRNEEIHKYQVKHVVDTLITDNLGRSSYRIIQYESDSSGTQPWMPISTYFITPLDDQVEVIEDNLRFIKLHLPFRLNYNWKGNSHLAVNPYGSLYSFSNDDNMNDWDYNYDTFESSASIGGQTLNDVYTVFQIDESLNAPVTDPASYGARTLAIEKYAKNIGLVYKDYILWEYQPNTGGAGGGYKVGFGISMWMIDHN
jgi:hypothetical protein